MLINPHVEKGRLVPYAGTRLLPIDLGLTGIRFRDPMESQREWKIQSLYAPIPGRAIGGVRAKLVDCKGFISFCNQRDLEIILGLASQGAWCVWMGSAYVGPEDSEWCGICADEEDLLDDLQERELVLRGQMGGVLPTPMEFTRRVHLEPRMDFEELHILIGDYDRETGFYPDTRFETIERRWVRSQRERIRWERV